MISKVQWILLLLSMAAGGCKSQTKEKSSGTKSTEALTSGDETKRSDVDCGDEAKPNTTPEEALERVLDAAPKKLKAEVLPQGTKVILDDDPTATCLDAMKAELPPGLSADDAKKRLTNLSACWVKAGSAAAPYPAIHVKRDVRAIHNATLAMLTYAYAEFYMDGILGQAVDKLPPDAQLSEKDQKVVSLVRRFRTIREQLATNAVADLTKAGKQAALNAYAAKLKDLGQTTTKLEESPLLRNYFLAEMTDAYYCSTKKTRPVLEASGLTTALATFKEFAEFFEQE